MNCKVLALSLSLSLCTACTGTKATTGLVASNTSLETTVEAVETIEVYNNKIPLWSLYVMGGGIFCLALIIPSPFTFKGFS